MAGSVNRVLIIEFGERMVDDPLEAGQRYAAKVNVRESSIDHMHSRGAFFEFCELLGVLDLVRLLFCRGGVKF